MLLTKDPALATLKRNTEAAMGKINYDKLSDRQCKYCSSRYKPTGPAQRACVVCSKHLENINSQVKRDIIRFNKFGTYERIGKGGSNKKGIDHGQYKNGIGFFHSVISPAIKTRRYCERCGKDLAAATRYEWCAHHKDHDQTNNVIDNIELLCKRCHQLEHDCCANLPGKSNDHPERE